MDNLHLLWARRAERSANATGALVGMGIPLQSSIYRSHQSLGRGISTIIWDISLQQLTEEKDFALSPEALAVALNFLVDCI
jgi:hypothetical protein